MFERPKGGERAVLVHLNLHTGFDEESLQEFKELVCAGKVHIQLIGYDISLRRLMLADSKAEELIAEFITKESLKSWRGCIDYAYFYADISDKDIQEFLFPKSADINICRFTWAFWKDEEAAVSCAEALRNNLKSQGVLLFEEDSPEMPFSKYVKMAEIIDGGRVIESEAIIEFIYPIRALAIQQLLALIGHSVPIEKMKKAVVEAEYLWTVTEKDMFKAVTKKLSLKTLKEWGIDGEKVPREVWGQIGEIIGFLHKNGLRHGDLVRQNIFLGERDGK